MPRVRPLEVRALIPLLEQDWDDVVSDKGEVKTGQERLVEALILELDKARASRTSYVGILRLNGIMVGLGPYPGLMSAKKALEGHPAWGDPVVTGWAVVPIESPEGYERRIKALDLPPKARAS